MPDRLPSLVVLIGFWVPPAVAGWAAAEMLRRSARRVRASVTYAALAAFLLLYAAAWFYFNPIVRTTYTLVGRMPPYIPGATADPTLSPPSAVAALAVFTAALVMPGSAIACVLAFRRRSSGLSEARPTAQA